MDYLYRNLKQSGMWAILSLAIFPLIFFWSTALGLRVFAAGDIGSIFLPLRYQLAQALAQGRFPLWSPEDQFGFPIFAEGHMAALYPLNLVLFGWLPIHLALNYSILLHVSWAAIGMYAYCRSMRLGIASAWLAGLVFSFSSFFIAHLQHLTLLAAAAWLPWLVYFQHRYRLAQRQGDNKWMIWFLLASLSIGLQLVSGFPQVVLINLGVFMALGLFAPVLWERHEDGIARPVVRESLISVVTALGSILFGAGLSAAQWLSAAELLGLSVRSQELGAGFQSSFSLEPLGLTQVLFPFAQLGEPTVLNMEFWFYLGIVPLGLVLVAPLLRRDARTWFFIVFGLGALSLTLGELNPLYRLLEYVPLYNRFRVPARFELVFLFVASFLAAQSFELLTRRLRDSLRVTRFAGVSIVVLIAILGGIIALEEKMPLEFWMNAWTILPIIFIVLTGIVFLIAAKRWLERAEWVIWVIGLTMVDLALATFPFAANLNPTSSPAELLQMPLSVQVMPDTAQPMYRMYTNIFNETLRPNHPMIYDRPSAQIYSPLVIQRNDEYVAQLAPAMLNLASIRYYFLPSGPLPPEFAEPTNSIMLDLFAGKILIAPTRARQIEIVSYTDQTIGLSDTMTVGELVLSTTGGERIAPIRLGIETADWAYDGWASQVKHSKPAIMLDFPGYLLSLRRSFTGHKYVARVDLADLPQITGVTARSNLSTGKLFIESVSLIGEDGHSVSLASLAHRSNLALIFRSHAVAVYENRDVLPRAWVTHNAEIVSDDKVVARMRQPDFDPEQIVFLSEGQSLRQSASNRMPDQVSIVEYKSERVTIQVKTEQPGYLVLSDTFYPDWQAFVDGQSTPIYRADFIFRAVRLEPGDHTIVFEYKPFWFTVGAVISLTSLVIVFMWGIGVMMMRARRVEQHDMFASV